MKNITPSSLAKNVSAAGAAIVFIVVFLFFVFMFIWNTFRVYVPSGRMAIVTAKSGKEPAPGTILVERGEKGIWREVLPEGRHFLNPVRYDVRIVKATEIPLGKIGIVISKVGKELPAGEIIAPDHDSKGVWRDVLGPGLYRLNPEGYTIEIADAINIPAGYVGVVTSQTGAMPKPGEFATIGEKGVLQDILQPGLYYINRYAYQVNVIEIGMNQVSMTSSNKGGSVFNTKSRLSINNSAMQELEANTLNFQQELRRQNQSQMTTPSVKESFNRVMKQNAKPASKMVRGDAKAKMPMREEAMADMVLAEGGAKGVGIPAISPEAQIFGVSKAVEFPSRDGFKVSLEMTVEFELLPEHISKIYLLYGDLPQVVEKIILPQVLSVSRLKGSSYGAQDFILGEGREKFQNDLREELVKTLATKNIIVHNAIIRTVEIPMDILQPIRAVSLAQEQNLTNISMQETAKKLGELNTETELIEQRRREVNQETEKLVATTAAECKREVETIAAEVKLKVAEIGVKRSELLAKITSLKGETEANVKFLTANESAIGEGMLANALGGGQYLAYMKAVEALNPKITTRVIYAGDGTLWTDLEKAALPLPIKPAPTPTPIRVQQPQQSQQVRK
ncbi:MAG: hypothetical protein IKP00_08655 [Victivallales bacterium]|nr:hypothetical protein [Victivallales bacterium]